MTNSRRTLPKIFCAFLLLFSLNSYAVKSKTSPAPRTVTLKHYSYVDSKGLPKSIDLNEIHTTLIDKVQQKSALSAKTKDEKLLANEYIRAESIVPRFLQAIESRIEAGRSPLLIKELNVLKEVLKSEELFELQSHLDIAEAILNIGETQPVLSDKVFEQVIRSIFKDKADRKLAEFKGCE